MEAFIAFYLADPTAQTVVTQALVWVILWALKKWPAFNATADLTKRVTAAAGAALLALANVALVHLRAHSVWIPQDALNIVLAAWAAYQGASGLHLNFTQTSCATAPPAPAKTP